MGIESPISGGPDAPCVDGSGASHSALDMKTLAWSLLGGHYRDATKRHMPRSWFPADVKHSHVAIDDAREQGQLFFGMWRALRGAALG